MSTHPSSAFLKTLNNNTMKQEVYTDYENIKEFSPVEEQSDVKYEFMQDWVFHFNPYTSLWNAIPRHLYNGYWSNYEIKGILRSKDINTLLYLLHRGKGNLENINKITSVDGNK